MKFTKEQIETFIANSNAIEDEGKTTDNASLYAWEYLSSQDKITPEIIRKTHGFLMSKKEDSCKI